MKIKGLILAATVLWASAASATGISASAGEPGPGNEDRAAILDVKGIFQSKYGEPGVAESFVAGKRWLPCPEYGDRAGWEELFGPDRDSVVLRGERLLDYRWQTIPATAYLAYERTGDRMVMESIRNRNRAALISLMAAELAEGRGRFIDQIVNCVWAASQEFSWVLSAHQVRQETGRALPDDREHFIDLGGGAFGSIMATALYLFREQFDDIDPSISHAVKTALRKQILDPYLDVEKYQSHWWTGLGGGDKVPSLNNWNPWCNSDAILCFLLTEDDQERLDEALERSVRSLDMFLRSVQQDGACEEGTSYWGHAAGKMYDWMQMLCDASDGRFSCFDEQRIRRMGEYISRMEIGDGYVVNFADASALGDNVGILSWEYGNATGSREMVDYGLYKMADTRSGKFEWPGLPGPTDIYRLVEALRFSPQIRAQVDSLNAEVAASSMEKVRADLRKPVPSGTWYDETEVCCLRGGSGWFLAAKGGYNAESHNHNDAGSCILYIRNIPVLVDAGVGTYTKQTFGPDRYEIWTMRSEWHNLPTINGADQEYGMSRCAKDVKCSLERGTFSADISGAYPEESGCTKWVRGYALALKGTPSLTVTDSYELSSRTAADALHFLVSGEVILPGEMHDGKKVPEGELLILCGAGLTVRMAYPKRLTAKVDVQEIDDPRLGRVWGSRLRRISLTSSADAPAKGSYTVKITEL